MREILSALIDDTGRQIELLDRAIRERDSQRCIKLAHYSKGACANVGAVGAATLLKGIEHDAAEDHFEDCSSALANLITELDRLRDEAGALSAS
jgi:HPt (histidine-containing phosphotransfer) domain-containing protein